MIRTKKGQDAALNATYLIGVIAVLILLYILLLPEGEKDKLISSPESLGQTPPRGPSYGGPSTFKTLLSESPGILYPSVDQTFTKPLASVNLFSTTESKIANVASTIAISSNLISADEKEITFRLNDAKNIAGANLLFFVVEGKGNLLVKLNGNEIFNDIPSSSNLPVPLQTTMLRAMNKLSFAVEKPGFLGSNKYLLRNIQLNTRVRHENNNEVRTFMLNKAERASVQGLTLYYVINCFTVNENGRLIIRLNNQVINDNLIVCDANEVSLDLSPRDLLEGRNVLEFEIDRGKYILERVLIEGLSGQQRAQNYFFTLQVPDLQIVDSGAPVILEIQFRRDALRKVGTVFVNGIPVYIDTFDNAFEFDITDFVTDGRNVIRIVPDAPFEVVNMNVILG